MLQVRCVDPPLEPGDRQAQAGRLLEVIEPGQLRLLVIQLQLAGDGQLQRLPVGDVAPQRRVDELV